MLLTPTAQALLSDPVRLGRLVPRRFNRYYRAVLFYLSKLRFHQAYGTFAVRLKSLFSVREVTTEGLVVLLTPTTQAPLSDPTSRAPGFSDRLAVGFSQLYSKRLNDASPSQLPVQYLREQSTR